MLGWEGLVEWKSKKNIIRLRFADLDSSSGFATNEPCAFGKYNYLITSPTNIYLVFSLCVPDSLSSSSCLFALLGSYRNLLLRTVKGLRFYLTWKLMYKPFMNMGGRHETPRQR